MKMWMMRPRHLHSLAETDQAVAQLLHQNVALRRELADEQRAKHLAQAALKDLQEAVHDVYTHFVHQDAEES